MKRVYILLTSLILLSCFVTPTRAQVPKPEKTAPTAYDDGKSCPGNCDAHVVFHQSHNGTLNAYDPSSSRTTPKKCVQGQPCKICFSGEESSCLIVTYRGAGPPKARFDFTPAFYAEVCSKPDIPSVLVPQCKEANTLKRRTNCFESPEHEKCKELMTNATKRKADDDILYEECRTLGQPAFNKKYKGQPQKQRSNACAYEQLSTGQNSKGDTWRRLLDGACRSGTYAGRDGLDCCSSNLHVVLFGRECLSFFPNK